MTAEGGLSGESTWARLTWAGVAVGVLLRSWQYLANPSLYLDELWLAASITNRDLVGLVTRPLELFQVAPAGFLVMEWIATVVFGDGGHALRLVPFLAGVAVLPLAVHVARSVLGGAAVPLALWMVALHPSLIHYSAIVKQYSLDVALALAIVLMTLHVRDRCEDGRLAVAVALGGFVAAWTSHAAVLVLAGCGAVLLVDSLVRRGRAAVRPALLINGVWAAGCIASLAWGLRMAGGATREWMDGFWSASFMPPLAPDLAIPAWFHARLRELLTDARYPVPDVVLVLAAVGVVVLVRRRRFGAAALYAGLPMALLAAALEGYPFRGRLILFLVPPLLLAVAAGIRAVTKVLPGSRVVCAGAAAVLALPALLPVLAHPPVYDLQPVRPVLREMTDEMQPGDRVLVYHRARWAVEWYADAVGLEARGYEILGEDVANQAARGVWSPDGEGRTWLVVTQVQPGDGHHRGLVAALEARGERLRVITRNQPSARARLARLAARLGLGDSPPPSLPTDPWAAHAYLFDLNPRSADPTEPSGMD